MTLREHLYAIKEKRGELTPVAVLEEARDPNHELHNRFEWDDGIAGEAWRREQAHRLIQSVYVTYKKSNGSVTTIREFYAVRQVANTEDDPTKYAYDGIDELKRDPIALELVRRDMQRDWKALKARYETFEEFWTLVGDDMPALAR